MTTAFRRRFAAGAAVVLWAASAAAAVEVFTLSWVPVRGADGAEVHVLDLQALAAAELSTGISGAPAAAAAEMRRRVAANRERLGSAARGVARAAGLGVRRLPAVVVDGRYVVYGIADVGRAKAMVRAWRRREGALDADGAAVPSAMRRADVREGRVSTAADRRR